MTPRAAGDAGAPGPPVANARMYAVNAEARAGWSALFAWLSRRSGVALREIEHAAPAPLGALWTRPDLGCAFMCGFPFARAEPRPLPVAAPVPRCSPVPGAARYATHLVVEAGSRFATLEDTFGGRLGFTVADSHSGFNAPRRHLSRYRSEARPFLYRKSVGPLVTPRRVVEAVLGGDVDVGPLDAYAFDLMLRHEPELRGRLRIVATTEDAPIPLLVASPGSPPDRVARLRDALLAFGDAPETSEIRDRLGLERFAPVRAEDYDLTLRWDAEAKAAGYAHPG